MIWPGLAEWIKPRSRCMTLAMEAASRTRAAIALCADAGPFGKDRHGEMVDRARAGRAPAHIARLLPGDRDDSSSVLAGILGLADMMVGTLTSAVTGAKSLSGSYPTLGLSAGLIAKEPESPNINTWLSAHAFATVLAATPPPAPRHVLDDERLAEFIGELFGKKAGQHIWIAARAGWHDQPHGTRRPFTILGRWLRARPSPAAMPGLTIFRASPSSSSVSTYSGKSASFASIIVSRQCLKIRRYSLGSEAMIISWDRIVEGSSSFRVFSP
jgi:hypothetical protein